MNVDKRKRIHKGCEIMLSVRNHQIYQNSKPFFYFADTCWSAFTNIAKTDWNYYLDYREQQGFNVVQINLLKQWDASGDDLNIYPFAIAKNDSGYTFDYSKINMAYFDRAEEMLANVQSHHMIPALVLLWANYVPDTWASHIARNNLFTFKDLSHYVTYVTKRFKKFHPIYFISGDTDFNTEKTISYYREVLKTAKENDPEALYSFHIKGRFSDVPEEFLNQMDFFSYQSGHNIDGQATAYTIPLAERAKFDGPMINTEPCYDQISYSRQKYGRFSPHDVRTAAWSSVLAGANAGITYGAHGIWSWHHTGASFGIVAGEGFDVPFDWHDALHFRGANDLAFLKQIMATTFPNGCNPTGKTLNDTIQIQSATNDTQTSYLIYLPTNTELDVTPLGLNQENSQVTIWDLQTHLEKQGHWISSTRIGLSTCLEDVLIRINKREG